MLYPVFTHLYLELVGSGHKQPAIKFLKKHQATFLGNLEFANLIRQLANVTLPEEIARDEVVSAYMVTFFGKTIKRTGFQLVPSRCYKDLGRFVCSYLGLTE